MSRLATKHAAANRPMASCFYRKLPYRRTRGPSKGNPHARILVRAVCRHLVAHEHCTPQRPQPVRRKHSRRKHSARPVARLFRVRLPSSSETRAPSLEPPAPRQKQPLEMSYHFLFFSLRIVSPDRLWALHRITGAKLHSVMPQLVGVFCLDDNTQPGLHHRLPLTSAAKIAAAAERLQGLPGANRAHALSRHLVECAASPPEAFLALVLQCPSHLGGYGLPHAQLNVRLTPSPRAQKLSSRSALVPDLLWESQKLVIEFDSDAFHLTSSQIERDASKRLALNADGYRVITVTSRQLDSCVKMRDIAYESALFLKTKFRQRSNRFDAQNTAFFREGPSLDFLFGRL